MIDMKKFMLWFFAVLGFIFFWIIIGVIYFVVADPFNLRPLIQMLWQETSPASVPSDRTDSSISPTKESETTTATEAAVTPPAGPNAAQIKALDAVGIDPGAAVSITPNQEVCFVGILGQGRVNDIKAGAVPTASEFFAVRGCL